jgi:molybdate transport system ATP-binding protein
MIPMLEMNVTLKRGHFVLATALSLKEAGTGVFGPSGAGKSTVLHLIAGTLQPQEGRIVLDGKTLFDSRKGIMVPREQRPVGAVLQHDQLQAGQKVRDTLLAAHERTPRLRRLLRLGTLIDLLELKPVLTRYTHELSAGETQRLALARALLKSPRLLLLDEPFAPLGVGLRAQLRPLLRRIQGELGISALYASHSFGELLELTDRLIVMANGRVLSNGTLRQVAADEAAMQALGLRQVDNILSATVLGHDAEDGYTLASTFGIELALPLRDHLVPGSPIHVSVRAGDIALSRQFLTGISIQNQIKGRVCALIPTGDSVLVQVDCGTTLLAGITPRALRDMALREGDEVYCLAKTQSFRYLNDSDNLPESRWLQAEPSQAGVLDFAFFQNRARH